MICLRQGWDKKKKKKSALAFWPKLIFFYLFKELISKCVWSHFDTNLLFESHVSSMCKTSFFHLKNISKLWHMLSMTNAEQLVNAFTGTLPIKPGVLVTS